MKKLMVLSFALCMGYTLTAQEKLTEGIITAKQTVSSDNDQINEQLALMGDMISTTYFKNTKSRSEFSSPLSGDITTITDMDAMQMLMLMGGPTGNKYMTQKIDYTEEMLASINLVEGEKTKEILGYNCKQFTVTVNQQGTDMKMELFVTEQILPAMTQQTVMLGDKLKGFPLFMTLTMNQQGSNMTITTEVTEIKKEAINDVKFSLTPPEGFEKMN